MKKIKKMVAVLLCTMVMLSLAGCGSKPCENCRDTPTKAYKNDNTGEKMYYCKDCSSDCYLCGDDADKHYTGGIGIVFVCNDCYKELKSYGWVS